MKANSGAEFSHVNFMTFAAEEIDRLTAYNESIE